MMQLLHERDKDLHDCEFNESELTKDQVIAQETPARSSSLNMKSPPQYKVRKIRVGENGIKYLNEYPSDDDDNGKRLEEDEENAQVLVAQSEPEILTLIRRFLMVKGISMASATTGIEAYGKIQKRNLTKNPFDIIVLDTHLSGNQQLKLASEIHQIDPNQKIVIITTTPKHLMYNIVKETGFLLEKDILTMPFRLMDFASLLGDITTHDAKSNHE